MKNLLEPTGFCWRCGRICPPKELFCSDKHRRAYERDQDQNIKRYTKAHIENSRVGWGISGG